VILQIDPGAAVPPYEQLRAQVTAMAASGALPVGTRLPSIRQLAGDLGLAAGTVARAYRELEQAGVIVTRGRHGTHVQGPPRQAAADERRRRLAQAARDYAVAAAQIGATQPEALDAVARAVVDLTQPAPPATLAADP
jgi:DNA-binding transcriptional regulator YhcF (GntR family)